MACIIIILVLNDRKLSSNMVHISEHINSINHKINSHNQMRKMILNLGSNKCEYNNYYTCQLNHLQNLLLMSIFDTPENYVIKVDRKLDKRKLRTYPINSS